MKKLAFWLLYAGVVALAAALVLPFVRPQWSDARGWVGRPASSSSSPRCSCAWTSAGAPPGMA